MKRAPLQHRSPLQAVPAVLQRPRRTGPARTVVNILRARDGGVCVVCGCSGSDVDPLVVHHRLNRGAGGSKNPAVHAPPRLLLVHASVNGWFEDNPAAAEWAGWKVRHGVVDPADVPVLYADGRRYLLDGNGGRTAVPW